MIILNRAPPRRAWCCAPSESDGMRGGVPAALCPGAGVHAACVGTGEQRGAAWRWQPRRTHATPAPPLKVAGGVRVLASPQLLHATLLATGRASPQRGSGHAQVEDQAPITQSNAQPPARPLCRRPPREHGIMAAVAAADVQRALGLRSTMYRGVGGALLTQLCAVGAQHGLGAKQLAAQLDKFMTVHRWGGGGGDAAAAGAAGRAPVRTPCRRGLLSGGAWPCPRPRRRRRRQGHDVLQPEDVDAFSIDLARSTKLQARADNLFSRVSLDE